MVDLDRSVKRIFGRHNFKPLEFDVNLKSSFRNFPLYFFLPANSILAFPLNNKIKETFIFDSTFV